MASDRGKLRRAHLINFGYETQLIRLQLAGYGLFGDNIDQQSICAQDAFNFQRLKLDRLRRKVNFIDIIKKDT